MVTLTERLLRMLRNSLTDPPMRLWPEPRGPQGRSTMVLADLTERQFNDLMWLYEVYYREAQRCQKGKSYLSGSIMIAAAMETALLATVYRFSEELARATRVPKRKGRPRPLLKWSLAELLAVAKELRWLPSHLSLRDAWDRKRAKIGDYAEVVRQVRNLVHPGNYAAWHSPSRVTAKHLRFCFEVLHLATEHLHRKLEDAIEEHFAEDRGR